MECLAETGANGPLLFGIIALALLAIVGAVLLIVRNRQHRNGALLALGLIVGLGLLPLASAPNAHAGVDCNGQEAAPAVTVTTTETAPAVTQTEPGTTVTQTGPTVTEPGVTSTETQTGPTVTETGPAVTTTATVTGPTVTTTSAPEPQVCADAGSDIKDDFRVKDYPYDPEHPNDILVPIPSAYADRVAALIAGKNAAGEALCGVQPIQWTWFQSEQGYTGDSFAHGPSSAILIGSTVSSEPADDGTLSVHFDWDENHGVILGGGPVRPGPVVATGSFLYTGPDGKPARLKIEQTDPTATVGNEDWEPGNPGGGDQ